uniref:Receptor ligand binding region domain-containing protein n=1 Tax=Tetradesmus obliquus TaxID=3088 RepID=A0A383W2N6_TETOB|eukprot:jgi/Sobl393_1/20033/SZX71423.1
MAKDSSSSSSSSSSCSCSCRGVAVILLLCLSASTASGKTDAANAADLFGIGILIQRNPPPRTVVKLPQLPSSSSSSSSSSSATAAAGASLPAYPAGAAEAPTDPETVTIQVPGGMAVTEADAAATGLAGSTTVTTTTTTTVTKTTTEEPAGTPTAVLPVSTMPAMQPGSTAVTVVATPAGVLPTLPGAAAVATVVSTQPGAAAAAATVAAAPAGVPATHPGATSATVVATPAGIPPAAAPAAPTAAPEMTSHPLLKPAFATAPASGIVKQLTPAAPAAATGAVTTPTGLNPVTSVPPAAGSSSSSSGGGSQPPPMPMAGPSVKAPPPFLFTQKDAKQTLLIGCSVPFEGSQQLVGAAVLNAMKMAVTELVPKELPGVAVNITCINSKCEDIPAYMAVSKFAAEGAIGVIGDICSRASVAAAGIANMRKIPIISPASTSPSLSETDFFFRTVPSDKFQGVTAANLVRKSGATVTALIYEDNAYGYGLAFNFIAGFTKERGTVPVTYQFKSGQGNPQAALADVVAGVRDKGVQAVFMSTNNLTFVAEFLVAAKAANLSLPIFGGDALADYMLYEKLRGRPSLIGQLTTTSVSPGSKDYVRAFTNFTGGDAKTSYQAYAAHAYDAVAALLRAYKAAAAPKDGPAVKAALGKLDFPGVGGRVRFDVFGDLVPDNQTYVAVKFNSTTGARLVQGFVSK